MHHKTEEWLPIPLPLRVPSQYLGISEYALIGDLHTVALVGTNGSIDWYCLPRIDSPSVFGALLDRQQGGFFCLSPTDPQAISRQLYYPETNVLLTRFATSAAGFAEVTDFMPVKASGVPELEHTLIRSLAVEYGDMEITLTCRPAFNYARDPHTVVLTEWGVLFQSQELALALSSPIALREDGQGGVTATFTLHQGEGADFALKSIPPQETRVPQFPHERYLTAFWGTYHYWHDWISQCRYQGRWREMVHRSALVLKLLTYDPTGAMVAAATTSLPETLGGKRNWDYRFTWLRDTAFTLQSLLNLGFTQEARAFMEWLNARCHGLKEDGMLQPLYSVDGEHNLTEQTLDHMEGYQGSRPVRIGNGAFRQKQLDIYGEILDAIFIYHRYDAISYDLWQNIRRLLCWLEEHWNECDEGIWEVRGGQHAFVHSRLMSWVAFDRAIRIARDRGWPAPVATWEQTRTAIYEEIMHHGWNARTQCFTQCYGSEVVDASTLFLLLTGFVGPHEPRMLATMERMKRELSLGASLFRYDPKTAADDGLERSVEGAFSACSFWFVECQAHAGQLDEAQVRLEKLLSLANHVGLYAEEISLTGALGNFPQALTHLALIQTCLALDDALNETQGRRYASHSFI
jgi:GH15 family glucan-1,4-alpha-glucosidase